MGARVYESRITAKGQTTIPVEIRDLLGLSAGDTIQFVLVDGRYEIIPRNKPASSLFGLLSDYAIPDTAVEDYRAAVEKYFEDDERSDGRSGEAA